MGVEAMTDEQARAVWRQGTTLLTPITRRWSQYERDKNEAIENKIVFANFHDEDEGRSRIHICTCETDEQARRVVESHNKALRAQRAATWREASVFLNQNAEFFRHSGKYEKAEILFGMAGLFEAKAAQEEA